jgi:hypothetical protein
MPLSDDDQRPRCGSNVRQKFGAYLRRCRARSSAVVVIFVIAGIALSGCGSNSLMVDPGAYQAYHCNDLVSQWNILSKREQDLRELMNKASTGGGGSVIGGLTYGTDYQTVLAQKKAVQQQAAEKNCELVHSFQSDQTIR